MSDSYIPESTGFDPVGYAARAALSRRGLFKAAGAVAAGVVLAEVALPLNGTLAVASGGTGFGGTSTLTTFDCLLKERYSRPTIDELIYPTWRVVAVDHQRGTFTIG